MITPPTWLVLVPDASTDQTQLWREHQCGRVHSDAAAREMVATYRIPQPYLITQLKDK